MRFGFAVKILGVPNMKSHDSRRWQNNPHISVSIGYFHDILRYLDSQNIRMYRISSDFAPYATHPDMPQFYTQVEECQNELAEVGEIAREYDIRLSFHPSQYIVLNSPDERIASQSVDDFRTQTSILDAMGQGPEAVVVTHVGGVYGHKESSLIRFIERYETLSDNIKRRLVLENDESSFSIADVLRINASVGIPAVFDYLHHMNYNPDRIEIREAAELAMATWPSGVTPKIHFSSPRTELREMKRKSPETGKMEIVYHPPLISQHSDYVNPFEYVLAMKEMESLPNFDVMLEAKAKDLALLKLREQLAHMGHPTDLDTMAYSAAA